MSNKPTKAYFVTAFKIQDHANFRCHMSRHQGGFSEEVGRSKMKVTEKRTYRIDGITGDITEIK